MGQHTVSRFLIKGFADKHGQVAFYDRAASRHRRVPFGSRIFETVFDAHAPDETEMMWGRVETRAGHVLARLKEKPTLQPGDEEPLRDLIAVHWARSRGMMTARMNLTGQVVEQSITSVLGQHLPMIATAYRNTFGEEATSAEELVDFTIQLHERAISEGSDEWHCDRNPINLEGARAILGKWKVQLGLAPEGSEFVIGDSPVIVMKPGHVGVGPHQGVALGDANQIAMPISPRILLGLGPTSETTTVTSDVARWYNERQWQGAQHWVIARPGGIEEDFMRIGQAYQELNREGQLP
ncbi:DUF4238 domain-containing protein [Nocardioides sp. Kera G14]|uniref:DUF4238 domain-containing protein n=1 Tax=Nocardioides sp. Kera G14 TaxID=2884264 RepID=UPI001D12BC90|nr:DUF4238 domain-containing protein [Nocardioides sp. Kera G14]UDY22924.1 DUF4238 domain-containing protein [Nocardioides sp. Kera G14]